MNFCRRCESEYDRPGTCNCFAEASTPGVIIYPGTVVPIFVHPVHPIYVSPYGTFTGSGSAVTLSCDGPVSGSSTSVNADVPFTPTTPLVTSENFGPLLLEAARQAVEYDEQH